jgi:hypothetical protein
MRFTATVLAEIRNAFRHRIATEPAMKRSARLKPKPRAIPAVALEPDYDESDILTTGLVAETFGVSTRTETLGRRRDVPIVSHCRRTSAVPMGGDLERSTPELNQQRSDRLRLRRS